MVTLGLTGSYGQVAAFARRWRADRQRDQQTTGRGTFFSLSFRPGEAFQFDWSEDFAVVGGERRKLQVAHIELSHSRDFLLRAYPLLTHKMVFVPHWHGFRIFGGVPGRGIYDNMKTDVDRVGRGKERQVNIRFLAMTNHYVFEPDFCNPAAGWEKGQVEKNVRDSRHQILQGMPAFPDLAALNAWLEQRCPGAAAHGTLLGTIAYVWAEEQAALMPSPVAFDGFIEVSKRVSPACLISFERNRYSVPASFANRPISLRIYPDRLVIAAEGNIPKLMWRDSHAGQPAREVTHLHAKRLSSNRLPRSNRPAAALYVDVERRESAIETESVYRVGSLSSVKVKSCPRNQPHLQKAVRRKPDGLFFFDG